MEESRVVIAKRGWQFYALRDAVIVAVALICWWGAQSIEALGIIAGIGLGLSAYLLHEWAHLLAAIRQKASVEFATRWYAIFLFNMRTAVISKRAFFDISFAGFFATLLYLLFFLSLPPSNVQAVALSLAQCLAALTLIFVAPIAIWAMITDRVPAGDIPFFDRFC
jgi:hypothetical protein